MAGRRSRAPLGLLAVTEELSSSSESPVCPSGDDDPPSVRFSEYQALVRRLAEETKARREGERAVMQRISDMREALVASNSEIWRTQRDAIKKSDQRLESLENLVDRALGRVSHLSGGLEGQQSTNKEQTEHLSRIDTALGTLVGQVGSLRDSLISHPRRSSALWGAVGAPVSLVVLGLFAWLLKRAGVDVGWP